MCITECVLSEEEEATDREHVFLSSSFSQSRYDKTAEVRHVTRLLQLQKNSDQSKKAKDYLSRVVSASVLLTYKAHSISFL